MAKFVFFSLLFHVAFLMLFLASSWSRPKMDLNHVVQIHMVSKAQKQQSPKALPEKIVAAPQPPAQSAPVSKVSEKPVSKTSQKPVLVKPSKSQKQNIQNRLNQLASKFEEKPSTQEAQNLGAEVAESYESELKNLIQNAYELPSIFSLKEQNELRLTLRLYINPEGFIQNVVLVEPSKKPAYDQVVLRAAKDLQFVGKPPLNLAKQYAQRGVLLRFCPISCE